jgi:hypothetical protein
MSAHAAFRRQPVDQQVAQHLRTITIPAPTRGIIQNENEAYMQPGGALVQDNWAPTTRGVKLRGGFVRWCDLHALDYPAWLNAHSYENGDLAYDSTAGIVWEAAVTHISAASPTTFAQERAANPTFWTILLTSIARKPVISAFEYVSGNVQRMYAGQDTRLFDVTSATPVLIKSGQTSGNYVAAQLANAAGGATGTNWMVVCNESGDYPLRFNGTSWVTLDGTAGAPAPTDGAAKITGPAGSAVEFGHNLSYVWKYRGRLYFIEAGSMNAWYLPIDSVGGLLAKIPLAGAASRGGKLVSGASWSLDAGDGIDDKNVFITSEGEVLIFTGSNPSDAANWRQEGRYMTSPPMGMNAHLSVGGDLLLLTVDGIIPLSQAITKEAGQLELAMLTRTIKPLWREAVAEKRAWPWTAKKWDEYGGDFVALPGGKPGERFCLVVNNITGAWCRFLGYDATCFIRMRADMFFGTQDGIVMQADRTGLDDGHAYVATLVGGWEMFGAPSAQFVWHQARATFKSSAGEPFVPQLAATVDNLIVIPQPPAPGPDPGLRDVWDQALWGPAGAVIPPSAADIAQYGQWDQPALLVIPARNTLWISIGETGYSHAPIVQVTVAQQARPDVELIAIAAVYEPAGVNV